MATGKPSRPHRTPAAGQGATRNRPARPGGPAASARWTAATGSGTRGSTAVAEADRVVLGPVPIAARAAGVLLALAGLLGTIAVFPTYLVVDGVALSAATGPFDALVALVAPSVAIAVGTLTALGRVPRFGLAYAGVAAGLAVGRLLIELYQGLAATTRSGVEVLAGELVVTGTVATGAGWLLGVVALGVTVLAGLTAAVAWGRTVMEDAGALDPLRPALAGAAVLLGAVGVLCLALPAADVTDQLVSDPLTGLVAVVSTEGPRALLERPGVALLGGLLLAGTLLLCAVVAPSLRPRLGAVGGLLAVAVVVLQAALTGLRDALHSPDLVWSVPGMGLLLVGLGLLALTVVAWRGGPGRALLPGADPYPDHAARHVGGGPFAERADHHPDGDPDGDRDGGTALSR